MLKITCPFCLNNHKTMVLKFDKKHFRPYFTCLCGMRLFIKHNLSIASLLAWAETLDRLDTNQLANLLRAGDNSLAIIRQNSPELEKWSTSDEALVMSHERS